MDNTETISKKLRQIARLYTLELSRELSMLKINRYFDILLTLSAQEQPITQKTLAALLHLDKSRMVVIINYLTQRGYTYTEKNPADRREHFVFLSTQGLAVIPMIRKAIEKSSRILLGGISHDTFSQCMKTLTAIENNLLVASKS